ncbi:maleylpyruvate isomerase family mycothiol-dependent enzyme [Actinoplanes sp. NPDC051861]|uniref:maleylpyruvate isomerase family mycothiol-dependent enzyme n=1 Tax=Actinoplanes sp. NPDC051861 TaxID=3155170 RepID=UPI0034280B90
MSDVIDDLEAEQDRLDAVLGGLTPQQWLTDSAAAGWTVADVVLHLAQTEEAVAAAVHGDPSWIDWRRFGDNVDDAMNAMVRAQQADPDQIYQRWRDGRREALRALRAADPQEPIGWVASAVKPRTLATTRLAEHWAHGLDVTIPFGIEWPDTDRLRHVAWLGFSTLRYAYGLTGRAVPPVFCDLYGPDGSAWQFGDPGAESVIAGPGGAFCRVGAQRLTPAESGLKTTGPHGAEVLAMLRNYADT